MSLSPPPADPEGLGDFPEPDPPVGPGRPALFRIFQHRDPKNGRVRGPFYFGPCSSAPDAPGGRYDLPHPHGACYLTLSPIGAWLEVFRTTRIVASDDLRRRRLLTTRPPRRVRTADLLARRARGYGVSGEIHAQDDYALTRAWALRFYEAGFRALLGKVRHDPGLRERSLTLLDKAGEHAPYGWRWRTETQQLQDAGALLASVESYGYRVLAPPHDVVTEDA